MPPLRLADSNTNNKGFGPIKTLIEENPMALVTCPSCSAPTSDLASVCSQCGQPIEATRTAPIKTLSGKLSLIGALVLTIAIIGTVLGTWWGPAALLPGIAFYMMAKFL